MIWFQIVACDNRSQLAQIPSSFKIELHAGHTATCLNGTGVPVLLKAIFQPPVFHKK